MLEGLRRYLRYTSWPIIAAMVALMVIGIGAIRACEQADPSIRSLSVMQTAFACVALGVFVLVTVVPYRHFGRGAYGIFAATLGVLAVLAAARVFGHSSFLLPSIRGAHRWISLGVVLVQPSEVAKLSFILMLAWYLRYRDNYRRLRGLIVPFALTLVPAGLVLIEPDLGTSLLFLPTLFFMLFLAGAKWRHLLGGLVVAAAIVFLPMPRKITGTMSAEELADRKALAYFTTQVRGTGYILSAAPLAMMEHHQVRRIDGWLRQGDRAVARDKGYQLSQSKMILGAGRATGRRGWLDADTAFRMLPDDHTDFIFSIVGGQWGFAGCAAVLLLYGVIFLFGVEIAASTHDPFGRLLAIGVLALLLAQIVINVGMTMGLTPITGMTLPLISYGGSSLVVNCAALGLLVNVGQRRPILLSRRPFEHGEKKEIPPAPFGPFAKTIADCLS